MKQTKLESFIEASINTAIGFIISYLTWILIVVPLYHMELSHKDNLVITLIFTVVSVIRGYVIRRYFNAGMHKTVHNLVKRITSNGT